MNTPVQLYAGAAITATTNTTGVAVTTATGGSADAGAMMRVTVPITTLKRSAGSETYSVKCQDSPDGSTWTDRSVNRSTADDSFPNTDGASGTIVIDAILKNPANVRLVFTLGGTSPAITIGVCTIGPVFTFFAVAKIAGGDDSGPVFEVQSVQTQLAETVFYGNPGMMASRIRLSGIDRRLLAPYGAAPNWFIGFAQLP